MDNNILKIMLDTVPYSVWSIGLDVKFKFVNKFFANFLDKTQEEIIGKSLFDICGENLGNQYYQIYEEVKKLGKAKLFKGYFKNIFLKCHISPMKDNKGQLIGFLGIIIDSTEEKKYEEEILKQKNLLTTLIDTIPDCIFYKDLNGNYLNCNKAFAKDFFNTVKEDVIGKKELQLTKNTEFIQKIKETDKIVIEHKQKETVKLELEDKNNTKYLECIKTPLLDNKGNINGIVGIARNITSKVLLEEKLKKISHTDKLTGVYNRTYFDEKIDLLDNEKYLPLSLIMGDVDGLKIINDTAGHLKGDELLIEISNILKNVCKEDNSIVRWGGDEFIILLPNTDEDIAKKLCKEINTRCKSKKFNHIPLSISLGYATKKDLNIDINDVLREAEEMAYKQKLIHSNKNKENRLHTLNETLKSKSLETYKHVNRVAYFAKSIAKNLNLNNEDTKKLELLAKFHDIGKIAIPDEVLSKPGKLDLKEMHIMRSHCESGYRISKLTPEISNIHNEILYHHERWDGEGYPFGLSKTDIPYLSRIIAVLDSYEAMTGVRSYKKKMSHKQACEELRKCSGSQFDPKIVDVFLETFEHLEM